MTQMKGLIRQRGAIGILAPGLLFLAILFAALAVDTGRLMMTQRHLQTVADMAALDASGNAGYCGTGDSDTSLIEAAANESAVRNGHTGTPLLVEIGELETIQGIRHFSPSAPDVGTAVRVVAAKTVPASIFAGGIWNGEVTLQAEAVAERSAIAGISAGTTLASVSTEQSKLLNLILGDILGSEINLDAVSYKGIADLDLRLIDLVNADASIGTVKDLLDADLSVGQLLTLYADAVSAMDAVDVNVLTGLNELIGANINDLTVALGDVVNVTTQSPEMAANATVNLLQLLTTSLMVANGDNAIALPLGLNLPGKLLSVSTALQIIEPPKMAIGPPGINSENGEWKTQIKTAQIRLNTGIMSEIDLNIAGLLGVRANVDLGLNIEVAQGKAGLKKIQCQNDIQQHTVVVVEAEPGIADVKLTKTSTPGVGNAKIEVSAILLLIPVKIAEVGIGLNLPIDSNSSDRSYYVDNPIHENLPQTQVIGTSTASLGNLSNSLNLNVTLLEVINLKLLDELISQALLSQVLAPILGQLGELLIDPLLDMLGIDLGIIEVTLTDVEIDRPELKR